METAPAIRDSIAKVDALRHEREHDSALAQAVAEVKAFQARRFEGSYADLQAQPAYAPAVRFFLDELYGAADYRQRDAQFSRIAGTLQAVFPRAVAQTAIDLALLHAQTEALDQAMARAWRTAPAVATPPERYAAAWRAVDEPAAREQQLQRVLALGRDLARLTRTPGLRTMLRMMRAPADAAGLGALQHFLEAGFDTFGQLARERGAVEHFLATIAERERALLRLLSGADTVASGTELARILGKAR